MRSKLLIEGMGCGHCIMAVKKELGKLDLVINDVNIGNASIEYDEKKIDNSILEKAIEEAGYKVKEIQQI